MDPIAIIMPLLSAGLVSALGAIIYLKGKKEKINNIFAAFALVITIWMFGTFMMFLSKNQPNLVIFWDRFIYLGVVFIPSVAYHFGMTLTNDKSPWRKKFLAIGYSLSVFFMFLAWSRFFLDDIFVYKWGIHAKAQKFHGLFLAYFLTYIPAWFVMVYKYYQRVTSPLEREKIKYSFVAFLVFAVIGSFGFLPAYGIGIYPFAYVSGVFFTIILAYAIIVHRLMDIKLVMRRSSVWIASLVSIIIPAFFIKIGLISIFKTSYNWIDVVILTIGIFVFTPLKHYYFRVSNQYLFSSLYDSKKVIANLSDRLRSILEVDKIYNLISEILSSSFHNKSIAILILNKKKRTYNLQYSIGFEPGKLKTLKSYAEITDLYISQNKIVIMDELENLYPDRFKDFIEAMAGFNIELLAPLNIKNKTIGLIVLGPKESGDMYNDEDLEVLKIVSAQMAISLENAILYEETRNFNRKLKQEVDVATADLRDANEKLKKLDAAKSEFISIASHQLRTPLTAIKGYVSMLLEGDFGELSPMEHTSLEKVFDSNERLIKLVENLLNVSRIESGRLQFNFEEVQLEKMVESVMDELSGNAKKKSLELRYNKPQAPLPKVNIDEEKVRQVVMNLIDNSIKYTKKGSVTVSLADIGNSIEFSVSDTGMGISPTDLPNLFQKFSRGTGTSLVHTEGTGLGLYVARQMMEAHHGKIWAESPGEGLGSRFCFQLPVIQKVPAHPV